MNRRRNAIFTRAVALSSFIALGAGTAASAATRPLSAGSVARVVNSTQPTLHTTKTQVGAKTETNSREREKPAAVLPPR
jgi:hypothetical protein